MKRSSWGWWAGAGGLVGALLLLRGRYYAPVKRVMDTCLAGLALVVLSPVMGVAVIAIKLTSKGPVLYHAPRIGTHGEIFDTLKFRTMVVDADKHATITAGHDSRITPIGKLLRATKIDELPQLWNIIRGDMSVVGPRPESVNIVEDHYTDEYRELFDARPGLTCTGNLLYYVFHEHLEPPDDMNPEEYYVRYLLRPKLLADMHYVRNMSFIYDWTLIFQTVYIIVCKWLNKAPHWTPKFATEPPENWANPPAKNN